MVGLFVCFLLTRLVLAQYDEYGFDPYAFDPYGDGYGGGYDPYGYGDAPPPFIELETLEQLEDAIKEQSITLGLFRIPEETVEEGEEPPVFEAIQPFVEVAKTLSNRGYVFAVSTGEELLEKFKVSEWKIYNFLPTEFLSPNEKPKKRFTGSEVTEASLTHFIAKNNFPIVGQITEETEFSLYHQESIIERPICAILSRSDVAWRNYLLKRMRKAATEQKSVIFTLLDKSEASKFVIFNSNTLGVDEEELKKGDYVGVYCRDVASRSYYQLIEPFSAAALLNIAKYISNGGNKDTDKIKKLDIDFIEPEYQEQASGTEESLEEEDFEDPNVLVLTSGSLEELLENLESDLLVEFYAPWCGYCQRFKKDYSVVAESLNDKNIIVAKINADEEAVPPQFVVNGYPTIYYVKKDYVDKPVIYAGELTSAEVLRFYDEVQTMTKDEL